MVAFSIAEASLGAGRAKHDVIAAHEWNTWEDFNINICNNQSFQIEMLVVTSQLEFGFTLIAKRDFCVLLVICVPIVFEVDFFMV